MPRSARKGHPRAPGVPRALRAAEKLAISSVGAVAADLGVSERHLRRVFREAIGMSPKKFAKLARFHRALRAVRGDRRSRWASVAAATGYYDQAHLISEFQAIAGVTPRALLDELRGVSVTRECDVNLQIAIHPDAVKVIHPGGSCEA